MAASSRRQENAHFLSTSPACSRRKQSHAAVRIQAIYRGWRARHCVVQWALDALAEIVDGVSSECLGSLTIDEVCGSITLPRWLRGDLPTPIATPDTAPAAAGAPHATTDERTLNDSMDDDATDYGAAAVQRATRVSVEASSTEGYSLPSAVPPHAGNDGRVLVETLKGRHTISDADEKRAAAGEVVISRPELSGARDAGQVVQRPTLTGFGDEEFTYSDGEDDSSGYHCDDPATLVSDPSNVVVPVVAVSPDEHNGHSSSSSGTVGHKGVGVVTPQAADSALPHADSRIQRQQLQREKGAENSDGDTCAMAQGQQQQQSPIRDEGQTITKGGVCIAGVLAGEPILGGGQGHPEDGGDVCPQEREQAVASLAGEEDVDLVSSGLTAADLSAARYDSLGGLSSAGRPGGGAAALSWSISSSLDATPLRGESIFAAAGATSAADEGDSVASAARAAVVGGSVAANVGLTCPSEGRQDAGGHMSKRRWTTEGGVVVADGVVNSRPDRVEGVSKDLQRSRVVASPSVSWWRDKERPSIPIGPRELGEEAPGLGNVDSAGITVIWDNQPLVGAVAHNVVDGRGGLEGGDKRWEALTRDASKATGEERGDDRPIGEKTEQELQEELCWVRAALESRLQYLRSEAHETKTASVTDAPGQDFLHAAGRPCIEDDLQHSSER